MICIVHNILKSAIQSTEKTQLVIQNTPLSKFRAIFIGDLFPFY